MTQQGFEEYLSSVYGKKNGTANSYIMAVRIIDGLFLQDDVFGLAGKSITSIEDTELLDTISEFIYSQQTLFKNDIDSIFRNIKPSQHSYPKKGFCSAAMKQLFNYHVQQLYEVKAKVIVDAKPKGKDISKKLITLFKVDKEGRESILTVRTRIGQDYFREMILSNYDYRCCLTGLNVPQTLRASHIIAWADDKANRLNPENGLCLSATYDAAFDRHLISFDEDYRMIVSKEIRDYYTNEVTKLYFKNLEGKKLLMPQLYCPDKQLLEKHRNLLVG